MTVSLALLVKDPPLDRLVLLTEYLRPIVFETIAVVDDRTAGETVDVMSHWEGVTLVPFSWCDDFSAARNAALTVARGDWILSLDPDELPSPALFEFIRMVDASPWEDVTWQGARYPAPRGYLFFTRNFFDGIQGEEWEEHWHCRLFRRTLGAWYKPVHEQVLLDGLPEHVTRGTPMLPKAPRGACLLHSRMNDHRIDEQYAAMGERGLVRA